MGMRLEARRGKEEATAVVVGSWMARWKGVTNKDKDVPHLGAKCVKTPSELDSGGEDSDGKVQAAWRGRREAARLDADMVVNEKTAAWNDNRRRQGGSLREERGPAMEPMSTQETPASAPSGRAVS